MMRYAGASVEHGIRHRRFGRARRRGVLLGAALALLVAACGTDGDPGDSVRTGVADDASTVAPRFAPALVWTGSEVFVFGGTERSETAWDYRDDGALLSADLAEMEPLPPSPFSGPLRWPSAVALDGEVVVAGLECEYPEGTPRDFSYSTGACVPGTFAVAHFDLGAREWKSVELPAELADFDLQRAWEGTGDTGYVRSGCDF